MNRSSRLWIAKNWNAQVTAVHAVSSRRDEEEPTWKTPLQDGVERGTDATRLPPQAGSEKQGNAGYHKASSSSQLDGLTMDKHATAAIDNGRRLSSSIMSTLLFYPLPIPMVWVAMVVCYCLSAAIEVSQ